MFLPLNKTYGFSTVTVTMTVTVTAVNALVVEDGVTATVPVTVSFEFTF